MNQKEALKKAVNESEMTITEICKRVGISTQTYRNFLKRDISMSVHTLEKFADVLGKEIVWIQSQENSK